MASLLLRRLRDMIIVLLVVGTVMFLILHMIPGTPASTILGPYATQDQVDQLNAQMGYDRPLIEQYFTWIWGAVRGDLGSSFSQGTSVLDAIVHHLGPTLVLAVSATLLAVVVAVPLALHTVARPLSWTSRTLLTIASLGLAVPNFWLGLILILVFSVQLNVFPVSGYVSPLENPVQSLWYLALPLVVILSHQVSLLVMTLRESLSSELLQPFIRTARSKGLYERKVYYRHLLPNALLPAITVIGSNFGSLLGGIIIIETVFLIPGLGWALQGGISSRDYNLVLGISLFTAFIFVVVNLLVDLIYGLLDPRVRVR